MQIRDAKAVVPGDKPAATQKVGRFEQVRNDTFRDFVQRPNDSFSTDDKANILKLTAALIDTKFLAQMRFPAFGDRVDALEELATRQDIDLRTISLYEDRAQKFAMDVVDEMRGWTDKELDYALDVGSLSGTKFTVSVYEDKLQLFALDTLIKSPLPLQHPVSQIGFHALLEECQEPPLEIILKEPFFKEKRSPHLEAANKPFAPKQIALLQRNPLGGGTEPALSSHPHIPSSAPPKETMLLDLVPRPLTPTAETLLTYLQMLDIQTDVPESAFGLTELNEPKNNPTD